jgi:hypothetical protein
MKRNTRMMAVMVAATLAAGTAQAGRIGRAIHGRAAFDSIGVRPQGEAPARVRAGDVVKTELVGAAKLAAYGMTGLKEGDAIEVKILEPGKRFEVKHTASGQVVTLEADDQGVLKAAATSPQDAVRPAAAPRRAPAPAVAPAPVRRPTGH